MAPNMMVLLLLLPAALLATASAAAPPPPAPPLTGNCAHTPPEVCEGATCVQRVPSVRASRRVPAANCSPPGPHRGPRDSHAVGLSLLRRTTMCSSREWASLATTLPGVPPRCGAAWTTCAAGATRTQPASDMRSTHQATRRRCSNTVVSHLLRSCGLFSSRGAPRSRETYGKRAQE